MVPVNGRPFLEWLILHLQKQGISRFVLCVGYLGEQIQNHFEDGRKWDCRIDYSVEKELLGTGGAIKKAAPLLDELFLAASGDNYLELDYPDLFKAHQKSGALGTLACWKVTKPGFEPNLLLDEKSGRVLDYAYRNPNGKNYLDSGVKIFSRAVFSYFPAQDEFSLEADVIEKIASRGLLAGYPIRNPALDVGTPEGLAAVRNESALFLL